MKRSATFKEHRDDQEAFYAYMDKLRASGRAIQIDPTDPESASLSDRDSSRAAAIAVWGWLKRRAADLNGEQSRAVSGIFT